MVAKKYVFGEDSERAEATRRAEKAMVRKAHRYELQLSFSILFSFGC